MEFLNEISEHTTASESVLPQKNFSRHFLVLTISNRPDQYQLGPSDQNWPQTPLICESEICPGFSGCNELDMRRWRSVRSGVSHQFADLTFLDVGCSVEQAKITFMDNNANSLDQSIDDVLKNSNNNNFEKGLYEEVQSVEWEGPAPNNGAESDHWWETETEEEDGSGSGSSCWGDYPMGTEDGEERIKNSGYILIGHQTISNSASQFASDWPNWCAIRDLSQSLPLRCTFRRVALYRQCTRTCRYTFVILTEVDNAMQHLRQVINCINNAQSLCLNRAYIGFYQEIEFEVDVEVLQKLVASGTSINCLGRRLVVQFGTQRSNNPRKNTLYQGFIAGGSVRASSITSPSASLSTALNLLNNNCSMAKSGTTSEFDAEMEEIGEGEDENGNNGNEQGGQMAKRDQNGANNPRKSSWLFVKNLFSNTATPSDSERRKGIVEVRKISGNNNQNNNNNENAMIRDGKPKGNGGERMAKGDKQFNRIKSAFSLKQSMGSFWRKMSTKY